MAEQIHLGGPGTARVVVAPWRGGKITSLRDRRGVEWLVSGELVAGPTGAAFVDAEMCGWDECAPTVDATTLFGAGGDAGGSELVALSDHGDLWDQAWDVVEAGGAAAASEGDAPKADAGRGGGAGRTSLTLRVRGTDWPYELTRTITVGDPGGKPAGGGAGGAEFADVPGPDAARNSAEVVAAGSRTNVATVRLDYTVTSRDTVARPFLWVAHPQFVAPHGSRVEIDADMVRTQPTCEVDQPKPWDPALPDVADGETGKWWSKPDELVTSATLIHPDGGRLTVRAEGEPVRWYGIWADGAVYAAERAIALEPATGWYDDTAAAQRHGTVLILPPGQSASWSVVIELP